MKRIMLSVFLITLVACSKTSSPSKVVKQFSKALCSGNVAGVTKHYSHETLPKDRPILDEAVEKAAEEARRRGGLDKVEIIAEQIDGWAARVSATLYFKNGSTENIGMQLLQEKSGWKVVDLPMFVRRLLW